MKGKFVVENVGRPYAPSNNIPSDAWSKRSEHASMVAAFRAIERYKAHLSVGSWDDHYRVIDPLGNIVSRDEYLNEMSEREIKRHFRNDR